MADDTNIVAREAPDVPEDRAALVKRIQAQIKEAKTHWDKRFKRMRAHQRFVRGKQWANASEDDDRYVANVTQRHIAQRTADLYAKNPRVVYKRRPRMDFAIWDGDTMSLQQAGAMMAGQVPVMDPMQLQQAQMLLADVQNGKQQRAMIDRVGRTLQTVYEYSISEPKPKFKPQVKQAIRRALINGVAYAKIGYQRIMEVQPEIESQIRDFTTRLSELQRLTADVADGEIMEGDAEMEELRVKIAALQAQQEIVVREGLVFGFPPSTSIIPDPAVRELKGFVGAGWVAQEYCYSPEKVQEIWGRDVGSKYTAYNEQGDRVSKAKKNKPLALVYEFYDLPGQIMYTVCDGYPDFLSEPGNPDIELEQFHPFYTLTLNDIEDEEDPYPESNVQLIQSMQMEINRNSQALREHRIGARPMTMSISGIIKPEDKIKLETYKTNENVELDVPPGTDLNKVFVPKQNATVDPALYENEGQYAAILRVTGDSESALGGTAGDTATESTLAANTRAASIESNKDDIDEWLSDIAEGGGQILLQHMSLETVQRIAGPGASWPDLSRKDIAEQIYLEVAAGSSGRPNRQLDIANTERMAPFLLQTPSINPEYLAKRMVSLIDDEADYEDAIIAGVPSITAMNAIKQPGTGDPESDPNQQGDKGGDNAQKNADEGQPGPQAGFPAGA